MSSHSTRRDPEIAWEAPRSDPRYAPPRTVALAAAALPMGFAVAEATGVRALGGVVIGAFVIAALLTSRSSKARQAAFNTVMLALFIASHLIADTLTTAGAIALVTVTAAIAAFWILQPAPGS